jgi:butyrate kinase
MKSNPNILTINTGSTSTKLALFKGNDLIFEHNIHHDPNELMKQKNFSDKAEFRKNKIAEILNDRGIKMEDVDLFMCRGGLLKPVESGVYKVNEKMLDDLKNAPKQHASNLAAVVGYKLSENKNNVYIADPVVVDEMQDIARYSGHKDFERISIFHALNQKAVARRFAQKIGKRYEDLNLIVAHMGGGVSIGAHKKGKVIDVNQALDGEGPFSPERSGTLPMGDFLQKAFSQNYSFDKMKKMLVGEGGVVSYLGTNNLKEIEKESSPEAMEVLKAMAYQIAKYIGEMAVVLKGNIDAIILTGGVAYSPFITEYIIDMIQFLAPVEIYPGEDEMKALAYNGVLLWRNELIPKEY